MSFPPHLGNAKGNNLSDREREVLDRQRRLAASVKGKLAPDPCAEDFQPRNLKVPAKNQPSVTTTHGPPRSAPLSSKPHASKSQMKSSFSLSSTIKSGKVEVIDLSRETPSDQQKRPTKRTKQLPSNQPPASLSSVSSVPEASFPVAKETNTADAEASKKISSPILLRKKYNSVTDANGNANGNALLAKLVFQASSNAQGDGGSMLAAANSSYGQYEPNDYWRNLRDWDFISQFDQELSRQNQSPKKDKDTKKSSDDASKNSKQIGTNKSIPNTFISHRHYIAAWAPLVMQEARAQLLSEILSNVPNWASMAKNKQRQQTYYVQVSVKTWQQHRDIAASSTLDSLTVQISPKNRSDNSAMPFMANDLCLLLPLQHRDILIELYTESRNHAMLLDEDDVDEHMNTFQKFGLVGHTEVSRKELHGLLMVVSKKWWAQLGQENMVIVKLSSNITALREFTALTKVESLPLQRFLIGRDLADRPASQKSSDSSSNAAETENDNEPQRQHNMKKNPATVSVLLDKMGGVQALGKGFTQFAMKKFNTSQLTAISASANEYGNGGFTLIKGPPGTGKTTTLVGILNSLHILQYNKYYDSVCKIAAASTGGGHNRQSALGTARKAKPRLLVCAPSNAAVDNVILKIMEDGFIDGSGCRYNPSMIRVGVGQSAAVRDVALETKVDAIFSEHHDIGRLEASIAGLKMELQRITMDIGQLCKRIVALGNACPWPLSKDWEIRVDETTFDETGRVYFLNHKEKTTTFETPPPPEPGEAHFASTAMPEYRSNMGRIVKLVENYFSVKSNLERCTIVKGAIDHGANQFAVRQDLETHVLNSVHLVMTTLGTAGNRVMEMADKFEVVVIDEAAQSVEPSTLAAFQLGSRHSILVGDPQQLPATVFNLSGRNTKYDRSLFQRLEEAGHLVYMLNEQYRMHPAISHFPRHIFYRGQLLDGPNVLDPNYGNPTIKNITKHIPNFKPFTVLDLDSKEERGGTSLSNSGEAQLAVHLYLALREKSDGVVASSRVAVITPYAQQANLLRRSFADALGSGQYERFVEVNTVDAFQGREASIVIFSAVRADGSKGIGFLSDVRRMNVALTRAKHFLFVLCRCESIVVNPYWRDLVQHACETNAVIRVPYHKQSNQHKQQQQPGASSSMFGDPVDWF